MSQINTNVDQTRRIQAAIRAGDLSLLNDPSFQAPALTVDESADAGIEEVAGAQQVIQQQRAFQAPPHLNIVSPGVDPQAFRENFTGFVLPESTQQAEAINLDLSRDIMGPPKPVHLMTIPERAEIAAKLAQQKERDELINEAVAGENPTGAAALNELERLSEQEDADPIPPGLLSRALSSVLSPFDTLSEQAESVKRSIGRVLETGPMGLQFRGEQQVIEPLGLPEEEPPRFTDEFIEARIKEGKTITQAVIEEKIKQVDAERGLMRMMVDISRAQRQKEELQEKFKNASNEELRRMTVDVRNKAKARFDLRLADVAEFGLRDLFDEVTLGGSELFAQRILGAKELPEIADLYAQGKHAEANARLFGQIGGFMTTPLKVMIKAGKTKTLTSLREKGFLGRTAAVTAEFMAPTAIKLGPAAILEATDSERYDQISNMPGHQFMAELEKEAKRQHGPLAEVVEEATAALWLGPIFGAIGGLASVGTRAYKSLMEATQEAMINGQGGMDATWSWMRRVALARSLDRRLISGIRGGAPGPAFQNLEVAEETLGMSRKQTEAMLGMPIVEEAQARAAMQKLFMEARKRNMGELVAKLDIAQAAREELGFTTPLSPADRTIVASGVQASSVEAINKRMARAEREFAAQQKVAKEAKAKGVERTDEQIAAFQRADAALVKARQELRAMQKFLGFDVGVPTGERLAGTIAQEPGPKLIAAESNLFSAQKKLERVQQRWGLKQATPEHLAEAEAEVAKAEKLVAGRKKRHAQKKQSRSDVEEAERQLLAAQQKLAKVRAGTPKPILDAQDDVAAFRRAVEVETPIVARRPRPKEQEVETPFGFSLVPDPSRGAKIRAQRALERFNALKEQNAPMSEIRAAQTELTKAREALRRTPGLPSRDELAFFVKNKTRPKASEDPTVKVDQPKTRSVTVRFDDLADFAAQIEKPILTPGIAPTRGDIRKIARLLQTRDMTDRAFIRDLREALVRDGADPADVAAEFAELASIRTAERAQQAALRQAEREVRSEELLEDMKKGFEAVFGRKPTAAEVKQLRESGQITAPISKEAEEATASRLALEREASEFGVFDADQLSFNELRDLIFELRRSPIANVRAAVRGKPQPGGDVPFTKRELELKKAEHQQAGELARQQAAEDATFVGEGALEKAEREAAKAKPERPVGPTAEQERAGELARQQAAEDATFVGEGALERASFQQRLDSLDVKTNEFEALNAATNGQGEQLLEGYVRFRARAGGVGTPNLVAAYAKSIERGSEELAEVVGTRTTDFARIQEETKKVDDMLRLAQEARDRPGIPQKARERAQASVDRLTEKRNKLILRAQEISAREAERAGGVAPPISERARRFEEGPGQRAMDAVAPAPETTPQAADTALGGGGGGGRGGAGTPQGGGSGGSVGPPGPPAAAASDDWFRALAGDRSRHWTSTDQLIDFFINNGAVSHQIWQFRFMAGEAGAKLGRIFMEAMQRGRSITNQLWEPIGRLIQSEGYTMAEIERVRDMMAAARPPSIGDTSRVARLYRTIDEQQTMGIELLNMLGVRTKDKKEIVKLIGRGWGNHLAPRFSRSTQFAMSPLGYQVNEFGTFKTQRGFIRTKDLTPGQVQRLQDLFSGGKLDVDRVVEGTKQAIPARKWKDLSRGQNPYRTKQGRRKFNPFRTKQGRRKFSPEWGLSLERMFDDYKQVEDWLVDMWIADNVMFVKEAGRGQVVAREVGVWDRTKLRDVRENVIQFMESSPRFYTDDGLSRFDLPLPGESQMGFQPRLAGEVELHRDIVYPKHLIDNNFLRSLFEDIQQKGVRSGDAFAFGPNNENLMPRIAEAMTEAAKNGRQAKMRQSIQSLYEAQVGNPGALKGQTAAAYKLAMDRSERIRAFTSLNALTFGSMFGVINNVVYGGAVAGSRFGLKRVIEASGLDDVLKFGVASGALGTLVGGPVAGGAAAAGGLALGAAKATLKGKPILQNIQGLAPASALAFAFPGFSLADDALSALGVKEEDQTFLKKVGLGGALTGALGTFGALLPTLIARRPAFRALLAKNKSVQNAIKSGSISPVFTGGPFSEFEHAGFKGWMEAINETTLLPNLAKDALIGWLAAQENWIRNSTGEAAVQFANAMIRKGNRLPLLRQAQSLSEIPGGTAIGMLGGFAAGSEIAALETPPEQQLPISLLGGAIGALGGRQFARMKNPFGGPVRMLADVLNMSTDDALKVIRRGHLLDREVEAARFWGAEQSAGMVAPGLIPELWLTPAGRILSIFHALPYRSFVNTGDLVLRETGHGNLIPLMRSIPILIGAGLSMKGANDYMAGRDLNPEDKNKVWNFLSMVLNPIGFIDKPIRLADPQTRSFAERQLLPVTLQQVSRFMGNIFDAGVSLGQGIAFEKEGGFLGFKEDPNGFRKSGAALWQAGTDLNAILRFTESRRMREIPTKEEAALSAGRQIGQAVRNQRDAADLGFNVFGERVGGILRRGQDILSEVSGGLTPMTPEGADRSLKEASQRFLETPPIQQRIRQEQAFIPKATLADKIRRRERRIIDPKDRLQSEIKARREDERTPIVKTVAESVYQGNNQVAWENVVDILEGKLGTVKEVADSLKSQDKKFLKEDQELDPKTGAFAWLRNSTRYNRALEIQYRGLSEGQLFDELAKITKRSAFVKKGQVLPSKGFEREFNFLTSRLNTLSNFRDEMAQRLFFK